MLYKSISDVGALLEVLEVIVRKKSIILALYPDKKIQQSLLAEQTGIKMSNLSNDLKLLKEHGLVEVLSENTEAGYSANFVRLTRKALESLESSSQILKHIDKKPLHDKENYRSILNGLLDLKTCEAAADAVQIYSRKYLIPFDAGFYQFLSEYWGNEALRNRLIVLMKSANNMVNDLNDEDKLKVIQLLGSKLDTLMETETTSGLRNEAMRFIDNIGLYNFSYSELKERYLTNFMQEKDPSLFRSIIARYHKDKLMDLWLGLMQQQASAPLSQKSRYAEEFSTLSSMF